MSTTTTNLGLTLPAGTDPADIAVLNTNFGLIDTFAGQQTAKDTAQDGRLTDLEAADTAQAGRLTALETSDTAQDSRLTAIETKNTAQDDRLTAIETKDTTQDGRLTDLETSDTSQNGRLTAIETKNTAQDGRLTDLETSDTAQDAMLVRLTDAGAKNLAKLGFDTVESVGITVTRNDDGSLTLNGTSTKSSVWILIYDLADGNTSSSFAGRRTLPAGRYFLKGTGNNSVRIQIFGHDGTNAATLSNTSNDAFVNVDDTWPYHCLRIWIAGGASFDHQTIWPMLCKAEDYAVSAAFTPYAPTLRELYEMVLALQAGGGAS